MFFFFFWRGEFSYRTRKRHSCMRNKKKLNTRTRTSNCDSDERFFPSGNKNYVQNNVLASLRQAGTSGYLIHFVNRSGEQLRGSRLVYFNWEGSNDRIEVTPRVPVPFAKPSFAKKTGIRRISIVKKKNGHPALPGRTT